MTEAELMHSIQRCNGIIDRAFQMYTTSDTLEIRRDLKAKIACELRHVDKATSQATIAMFTTQVDAAGGGGSPPATPPQSEDPPCSSNQAS